MWICNMPRTIVEIWFLFNGLDLFWLLEYFTYVRVCVSDKNLCENGKFTF